MKFLIDLFSVLLFFGTYWYTHNVFTATAVAIVATVVQVTYMWLRYRHVDTMQWFVLAIVVLLGGATLLFQDKHFIMWKPTVLYTIMGIGLFISERLGRNGIRAILKAQIELPEKVWSRLCYAWATFFLVMAILNLIIAYRCSEAVWVNFKLFGGLVLMVVFVIGQSIVLSRYIQEK
jgi:intracellular septation protein